MARTPRGRAATALAWKHLGLTPPAGSDPLLTPLPLEGGDGRF
jgi:Holliday junction DNA helicase RuvB